MRARSENIRIRTERIPFLTECQGALAAQGTCIAYAAAGCLTRRFGNSARLALALVERNVTHGVAVVDSRLREIDDRIRHFVEILQRDAAPYMQAGTFQYHFPRANPPNAMSPMRATIRPIQKLHTNIRTIPTMTIIPPAEIPADPRPPFADPAMRISFQCWMQSISLPAADPLQAPQQNSLQIPPKHR
jgi:hypothetical protein